jgi:hypothetical protein
MKKIILMLLVTFTSFGQNVPCSTFNGTSMQNWTNVLSTSTISTFNSLDNSSFLMVSDGSGASWIENKVDYQNLGQRFGDGDHCLCFDYKIYNDGVQGSSVPINIRLHLFDSSGNSIYFETYATYTENDDWIKICAPIGFCDAGGNLPSNAQGTWKMPVGQDCSYFNALMNNSSAVKFWIDIAGSSAQLERVGIDNICVTSGCGEVNNDGAYCCEGDNLVQNGNFENGNTGFTSAYSYQTSVAPNSVVPGQYGIVNSSEAATISPQWQVQDHTFCVNGSNSDFMVVNGRTQQAPGTTSVIYESTVTLDPEKEHKLCLNLKNLPQCTFDIIPRVRIELKNATFTDGYNGNWFPVNTTADLCDWLNINACFRPNGDTQTATIRIYLAEDGIGDGNDLALDDISIQEKLEQDSYITVEHVGASNQITASINDLTSADDALLTTGDCQLEQNYYWFVYEVSSYPLTGPLANITTGTFAWSSNLLGWNSQTSAAVSPTWGLTTMFPSYTFDDNKLYAIGLYIPSCCNSCYDEKWTYQLTFNFRGGEGFILTHDMKEEIKALFKMGEGMTPNNGVLESTSNLKIHPNPSSSIFNLDFKEPTSGEINVIDSNGRTLFSQDILEQNSFELNLENQSSGIYFVKIKSVSGEYSEKIIKK